MMPPAVGLLAWFILLLVLLRYDSANATPSPALWVPLIWMSIIGSRSPAQWLGLVPTSAATAFEEGSALDRTVYLLLIALAVAILAARHLDWHELFAHNPALTMFLLFGLASVIWSDFPFITFKRWIRDLGTYLMLLVVLSDPRPVEAISTIIRRLSYVLLILSIVLIKYYSEMGVVYNPWTGSPEYVGATTSKNMLGALCLISGLFYFWDTLGRWSGRKAQRSKRVLFVNVALIAMTLWLINLSDSATARTCLLIGCLIIVIVRTGWAKANSRRLTLAIPIGLVVYFLLDFAFDFRAMVAQLLGRDPTLTGRTGMWDVLLAVQTNPLLGVGYQSFWLGDRLATVWRRLDTTFLNEAHNGYLEIYLSLGLTGLVLLGVFMVSSYRTVLRQITTSPHFASLGLALWVIMVFYNFTEAAFGASLLWCTLVLCVIAVPRYGGAEMPSDPKEAVVNRPTLTALQRRPSLPDEGRV
jgi:exopolysaccharide production protein ExoQ